MVKEMKWLIIMMLISVGIQAQSSKTMIETIPIDGASLLIISESSNIEIQPTKGSRIIVEMTISIEGVKTSIIEALVSANRYSGVYSVNRDIDSIILSLNSFERHLIIRGSEVDEDISLRVYVPESMNTELKL